MCMCGYIPACVQGCMCARGTHTSKRTAVLMQRLHAARPSNTRNALPQGPLTVELSALPRVWFGMC